MWILSNHHLNLLIPLGLQGGLAMSPAVIRQDAGYMLDRPTFLDFCSNAEMWICWQVNPQTTTLSFPPTFHQYAWIQCCLKIWLPLQWVFSAYRPFEDVGDFLLDFWLSSFSRDCLQPNIFNLCNIKSFWGTEFGVFVRFKLLVILCVINVSFSQNRYKPVLRGLSSLEDSWKHICLMKKHICV